MSRYRINLRQIQQTLYKYRNNSDKRVEPERLWTLETGSSLKL